MAFDIGGVGNAVAGGALGMILGEHNDKRQIEQQQKLTDMQIKGQKQMSDYSQKLQYDMWDKTNYNAQVMQMKKAGLNPGLMYGMGGGGGTTTGSASGSVSGGSAPVGGQEVGMGMQMAMMGAQVRLTEAQAKKAEVEAAKAAGVDTKAVEESTRATKFQNELNELIGTDAMQKQWVSEKDGLNARMAKEVAEWNALKAAGFNGSDNYSDKDSPIAKALRAGYQKTEQDLENAKLEGNAKKAEIAVKQFEARMANEGFGAGTPWYLKLITDLLQKTNLGILGGK